MRTRSRLLVATVFASALCAGAEAQALTHYSQFRSPSGNIGCGMGWSAKQGYARCDALHHSWRIATAPERCRGYQTDFGQGFEVFQPGRRGRIVCAGDTTLGAGKRLRYGHSISHGGVKCVSERSGITCRNRRGHGFFISRERYRLF